MTKRLQLLRERKRAKRTRLGVHVPSENERARVLFRSIAERARGKLSTTQQKR